MDQDFYFEESNPKKAKLIIVGIIVIISALCVLLLFVRSRYTLGVRKNLVFEAGDKLSDKVQDYVTNKVVDEGDYTLLLEGVSTEDGVLNKVGEFTFKVRYKNITKKGKLKVVDTTPPEVEVADLTVGVDEEFELDYFVTKCSDYSMPCKVSYEHDSDDEKNKKEGSYTYNIIIEDNAQNKVKKEVKLIVKKNYSYKDTLIKDLKVDHVFPELSDWNGELVLKFDKGYDPNDIDGTDAYAALMEVTGGDLHNYLDPMYMNNLITESQIIEAYNRGGYVIGYAIRVKLDNGLYFYLRKY